MWPLDGGILELGGRGRLATWSPTSSRYLAAFGVEAGLVALENGSSLVRIERETGRRLGSLPVALSDGGSPDAAAVAIGERRAWVLHHPRGTEHFRAIVVECE